MPEPLPMDPKIEELVDLALNKAVRVRGPIKLYHGKNDTDGLFDKKSSEGRKAADYGFGCDPALWREEDRSSLNQTLFVRLLKGGMERLVLVTPAKGRKELVEWASELYRRSLLEKWSELAAQKGWEDDFSQIAECCAIEIQSIQKILPDSNESGESNLSGGEADFKRRMAHELVIAWKHAPSEDAKRGIATALKNSGIQQIGEIGETLAMDGGLHRCDGPAFPGDKVEVVETGWLVHDGVGEYLLEKAIVKLP